jgi:carbamoyltransferase
MDNTKPTLGIYGIQDRFDTVYPQLAHDHGLALMEQGNVKEFIQLERITRIKRDNKLQRHLPDIIREIELVDRDLDVVFVDNRVGRAFISQCGQIRFEAPLIKRITKDWEEGRLWWFNRELNSYVLNHELAHVFSCLPFFGEFKENSLLIHFDGGASLSNFSAWIYRQGKIIPVEHHWEMKPLTALYNANALTFGIMGAKIEEQHSVPGKMMGFAALGTYNENIEFWLRQHNWFENIRDNRAVFFERAKTDFQVDLKSFDQHQTFLQDVVATIQEVFMRETLLKIDDVNTLSNCKNLYYTGGCALNIQTNSAILESRLFDHVYIPPCADDSGLALGAAAFGEWKKEQHFSIHSPYLNNHNLGDSTFSYSPHDLATAAKLITEGKVLGICNGAAEAGPRALGNRSLLALPTKELAHKVSVEHKKREWYRPVSPVMLEKNTRYFTGLPVVHQLSGYMLLDIPVLAEKQHEIAGVIHANGSARIQTLFERDNNPYLFDLLTLLDEQYQVKALINTSFNTIGEPIIHTTDEALQAAREMGIDALVLNGKVQ